MLQFGNARFIRFRRIQIRGKTNEVNERDALLAVFENYVGICEGDKPFADMADENS